MSDRTIHDLTASPARLDWREAARNIFHGCAFAWLVIVLAVWLLYL